MNLRYVFRQRRMGCYGFCLGRTDGRTGIGSVTVALSDVPAYQLLIGFNSQQSPFKLWPAFLFTYRPRRIRRLGGAVVSEGRPKLRRLKLREMYSN